MATSSTEDSQQGKIAVTLSSRNIGPHFAHLPERRLVLTREAPSAEIGRASKVPTKGFIPAVDNAWFDSPVMSRKHAELVADFDADPKTVSIKDVGSLHGTFHIPNDGLEEEVRLDQDKMVKLTNGDIVRFGIDIFRSKETYPPCSVDFLMEEDKSEPAEPTNRVFTVPDDDMDEDEEYDESYSYSSERDSPIPSEGVSYLTKTVDMSQCSRRGPSIDLTQDDVEPPKRSQVPSSMMDHHIINSDVIIDLTSEPEKDADHDQDALEPSSPIGPTAELIPSVQPSAKDLPKRLVDLENYPFSDSEDDMEMHDYHNGGLARDDTQLSDSESDSPSADGFADSMSDESELNVLEDLDSASSDIGEEYGAADFEDEDEDSLHNTAYTDGMSSSASDEDVDAVLDAVLDSPPSSSPDPSTPDGPAWRSMKPKDAAASEASKSSSQLVPPFGVGSLSLADFAFTSPYVPPVRPPSPSDAALPKSHPAVVQSPDTARAQVLGEKTGKFEYFAARENNRAIMGQHDSSVPVSAIRETLGSNSDERIASTQTSPAPRHSTPSPPDVSEEKPATSPVAADTTTRTTCQTQDHSLFKYIADTPAMDSAWSATGERFINNPRNEELPFFLEARMDTPELDMTSAYTFQQSKRVKAGQHIRRLPIQDLLAQEPKNSLSSETSNIPFPSTVSPQLPPVREPAQYSAATPVGTKRSFEEAFVGPEGSPDHKVLGYSRADGHAVSKDNIHGPTLAPLAASAVVEQTADLADPITSTAQQHNDRPSKRRRFAQAAACVALGGAAAFSFMVSTAPCL